VINRLRGPLSNLDDLPFPDKDLFYDRLPYLQEAYTVMTGRGCPHRCTYCCNDYLNKLYHGKYLRRRSVKNVIEELRQATAKYSIKYIFFDDSTFTYDKDWLAEFSEEYNKFIGLPCFCWVYPTDVDEGLIKLLLKLRCKAVEMGVESLDSHVRENIFGRFYSNEKVANAIALFNKNRIFCVVDNIKGFHASPEEELRNLVRFYNQNRPKKIYIFEHRPFPKTKILEILPHLKEDYIKLAPFTITTEKSNKRVRQLEFLSIFTYFLPPRVVEKLLNKKLYYFFPPISSYNILEILPYFINSFKSKSKKFWYPIRGTRRRYLYYVKHNPMYFLKRLLLLWAYE
jgi:radical SAM superfamily enzyme YgiQ (UPF0313 family)